MIDGFTHCSLLIQVLAVGGSRIRQIDGFMECVWLSGIEIPESGEKITRNAFCQCTEGSYIYRKFTCISLSEVTFTPDADLDRIDGFRECVSLFRIDMPMSVEILGEASFCEWRALNEVTFAADARLREIHDFPQCASLVRIDIPISVEIIGKDSFYECRSLKSHLQRMRISERSMVLEDLRHYIGSIFQCQLRALGKGHSVMARNSTKSHLQRMHISE
jgi:hypothetical protein